MSFVFLFYSVYTSETKLGLWSGSAVTQADSNETDSDKETRVSIQLSRRPNDAITH
jgi:hypothetical protein